MKKNNNIDFSTPRRQSYSAIFFFIYRFFKIVIRQVWPILLAFLLGREELKSTLMYVVIAISVLTLASSILAFFKYFFYIKDNELVVEKGIFQKSKTNIPFERIQTINFEQSLLHQLLNVVKLEIDTAGSKGSEFSFAALDKGVANELRSIILSQKNELLKEQKEEEEDFGFIEREEEKEETVMKLSFSELVWVGLGQNHIRSFFLILVFFSWIFEQLNDIGMVSEEKIEEMLPEAILLYGAIAVISFAFLATIISILISLFRTILRYYEFRLIRTTDGFKVKSGLLNRRQISAKDHKIQIVSWSDNPLKRLMKMFDVYLKQASSIQVQNKKSIVIPGCNRNNLEKIKNYYFEPYEWVDLQKFTISKLFIYRRMIYMGVLPFLIIFPFTYYFWNLNIAFISILWLPSTYLMAKVAYRKCRFSINEHIIYIHRGLFGNYNKILKLYKVQNLCLEQSIYQRMNKLCDVVIFTASGKIKIPFLPLELGHKLINYINFKVETDKRSWM